MKCIRKGKEPAALRAWKRANRQTPGNPVYGGIGFPAAALKDQFLIEQGHICAYTMKRLSTSADGHIEHVQPRSLNPGLALDHRNMVVCFPANGGDVRHGYGAPIKADASVDDMTFVSPLSTRCEVAFSYEPDGNIRATDPRDQAALRTIQILRLDHPGLKELREAAIKGFGISRLSPYPLSAAEARRLSKGILTAEEKNFLPEFCLAIQQVAVKYAKSEEQCAKRVKGQRKSR